MLKSINRVSFMARSLSDLIENYSEGIHKIIYCKYGHDNKECEKHQKCEIKYKDQECYHEYTKAKGDSLIFKMFIL